MVKDGVEMIMVRTVGGPRPGNRFVPLTLLGGDWPPQEELPAEGGVYVLKSMSRMPEANHPNMARGAVYEWRTA